MTETRFDVRGERESDTEREQKATGEEREKEGATLLPNEVSALVELRIDMEEGETKTKIFFVRSHVMMIKTSIE